MTHHLASGSFVGVALATLFTLGTGCSPIPEAPTELDELSAYLFCHFETDQSGVLEAGLGNMETFFEAVDLQVDYMDRRYELEPLCEADSQDVEHPERDPSEQVAVSLVTASAFTPVEHTDVILLEDQTPVEPASPERFDRTFVEPSDPSCFGEGGCSPLRTLNDVVQQNEVMTIPYEMKKDFRWVELGEPGSGEWAILARSWCEEEAVGVSGTNTIDQMFSIDVLWPTDDGGARYLALWMESYVLGVEDAVIQGSATASLHQAFSATEAYLEGGR